MINTALVSRGGRDADQMRPVCVTGFLHSSASVCVCVGGGCNRQERGTFSYLRSISNQAPLLLRSFIYIKSILHSLTDKVFNVGGLFNLLFLIKR